MESIDYIIASVFICLLALSAISVYRRSKRARLGSLGRGITQKPINQAAKKTKGGAGDITLKKGTDKGCLVVSPQKDKKQALRQGTKKLKLQEKSAEAVKTCAESGAATEGGVKASAESAAETESGVRASAKSGAETESGVKPSAESINVYKVENGGENGLLSEQDIITAIKTFSAPILKRIAAIKKAGDKKLSEAVLPLINALYEPDCDISNAAAESLIKINDSRAIEPLIEISRRTDAEVIKEINKRLSPNEPAVWGGGQGGFGLVAAPGPYKFKELVAFKTDMLSKEYFQKDKTLIPRKELVLKGLKDSNFQMRQMAAKAAIGLNSEDLIKPLSDALFNKFEAESVRFMAAEALGGIESGKTVKALLKALKDENVAVRYSAAAALSLKSGEGIDNALIEALNDPDQYVRSSVAYALGARESPRARQALFLCAGDKSEIVRFSAAQALASFVFEPVYKEITKRLESKIKSEVLFCFEILGCINDNVSAEILSGYLENEDSDIAFKASLALSHNENPNIINELIKAAKRFDNELIEAAKKAASKKR